MKDLKPGKLYLVLRNMSAIEYQYPGKYQGRTLQTGNICLLTDIRVAEEIKNTPRQSVIEITMLVGKTQLKSMINTFAIKSFLEEYHD